MNGEEGESLFSSEVADAPEQTSPFDQGADRGSPKMRIYVLYRAYSLLFIYSAFIGILERAKRLLFLMGKIQLYMGKYQLPSEKGDFVKIDSGLHFWR